MRTSIVASVSFPLKKETPLKLLLCRGKLKIFLVGLLRLHRYQPPKHNMTFDLAPFDRWTLRDKAGQRRSPLR